MYKVQEWLGKYSDDLGKEPIEAVLFNDDRLARSLSALFEADRHSLMAEVSGNAIATHNLLTDEVHNDSTSVTFIGKYNTPDPQAVKLKHGHNKDFRPDCKQVVFGLNITSDGHVPLSYKLFDGNTTDDVTHIPNWNGLRALLGKEDFVYVADCKLCSQEKPGSYCGQWGVVYHYHSQGPQGGKAILLLSKKKGMPSGRMHSMSKVREEKAKSIHIKLMKRDERKKATESFSCTAV